MDITFHWKGIIWNNGKERTERHETGNFVINTHTNYVA
jgi:hypothetical protein